MKSSFTSKENVGSGLALTVILLSASLLWHTTLLVKISIVLLFLAMTVPVIFYPFSFIWLNFSRVMGKISSFIILTLIFILVVTPVALFRKLLGYDRLLLKKFKKGTGSVFVVKDPRITKDNIIHPY